MNPERTWQLWRRVLREPALAEAVIAGDVLERAAEFGLDPEQTEIAAEYAKNGPGVKWAVDAYRYRLLRVTPGAVAEGAPLTARALRQLGHDLDALAAGYVEASGWADRGPYVYTVTAEYLDHLERTLPAGPGSGPLLDLLRLERTAARLIARSARPGPAADGPTADEPAVPGWTGRGAVVRLEHEILGWLADPEGTSLADAPAAPGALLVRLDGSAELYTLTGIGGPAARAIEGLAAGLPVERIAADLGLDPSDAGLRGLLDSLTDWGLRDVTSC
ncbi:hypothetical protein GCM10009759_74780 [Kitasatospora saccharophila]|uniref:DNA-binding protein n=1 Tax=Kitasatospora saccharophila TaxID=407973 RepID=A0ABN2Y8Q6_9ACTN